MPPAHFRSLCSRPLLLQYAWHGAFRHWNEHQVWSVRVSDPKKKLDHFPRIWTASFVQHGEYVSYIHLQGLSTLSTNKLLGVNYSWFINQSESLLFLPRVVSCPCLPCENCARSASSSTWFLEAAELGVFQVRSMRSISGGVVNPIIYKPTIWGWHLPPIYCNSGDGLQDWVSHII